MPLRLNIDIDIFQTPGTPEELEGLKTAVRAGIETVWPGFGLPAQPEVRVQWVDEPRELFDFALRADGQPCPVPVYHPERLLPPLEYRILNAIFQNRTRLLTDEQLRQLRRQYLSETKTAASWGSAPLAVWRALAVLLLKHGFGLYRLNECFEQWRPDQSAEETFERLIENPETLTMSLQVNPALADKQDWTSLLPGFYQEIYEELGVIVPEMNIEAAEALPAGQFRLRFNDLWLPALPGLQAGESLFPTIGDGLYAPYRDRFFTKTPPAGDPVPPPEFDNPRAYILDWAKYWVGQSAGWYVNAGIVEGLLDKLEDTNRSLIIMVREQWPVQRLCGLLRALLEDKVSIRNLPEILDVLLRIDGPLQVDDTEYLVYFPPASRVVTIPPGATPATFNTDQLVSQVRAGLKYPIAFPHLRDGLLPCYNIDPPLLRDLRDGFFQHSIPTPGSAFYHLLLSVRDVTDADYPKPVLLAPTAVRPAIARLLRPHFPQLTVLGAEEVPPFFIPQVRNTVL